MRGIVAQGLPQFVVFESLPVLLHLSSNSPQLPLTHESAAITSMLLLASILCFALVARAPGTSSAD